MECSACNLSDSLVVERDSIIVDGAGYSLQGTPSRTGIDLTGRSNVTITNIKIEAFLNSIWLEDSSNNRIIRNNIMNNGYGIWLNYLLQATRFTITTSWTTLNKYIV